MEAPVINGKPAVWISVSAAEKINTGNFSNVDVGPVVYGKWVEDLPQKELKKEYQECLLFVETLVAEERSEVLKSLTQS